MKKVIIAGILIVAVSVAFLVGWLGASKRTIDDPEFKRRMRLVDAIGKQYQVSFLDWVDVYCAAFFMYESGDYEVLYRGLDYKDGKYKFEVFYGRMGQKEADRRFSTSMADVRVLRIKEQLEVQLKRWTARGYPISWDDFEFKMSPRWELRDFEKEALQKARKKRGN